MSGWRKRQIADLQAAAEIHAGDGGYEIGNAEDHAAFVAARNKTGDEKMKNRYGDVYTFEKLSDNQYTISGGLKYWRYGGKDGQNQLDLSDLGFVDPSGGPFISVGMMIEGRKVVRIGVVAKDLDNPERIIFDVE